jgi:hypothetical protein
MRGKLRFTSNQLTNKSFVFVFVGSSPRPSLPLLSGLDYSEAGGADYADAASDYEMVGGSHEEEGVAGSDYNRQNDYVSADMPARMEDNEMEAAEGMDYNDVSGGGPDYVGMTRKTQGGGPAPLPNGKEPHGKEKRRGHHKRMLAGGGKGKGKKVKKVRYKQKGIMNSALREPPGSASLFCSAAIVTLSNCKS